MRRGPGAHRPRGCAPERPRGFWARLDRPSVRQRRHGGPWRRRWAVPSSDPFHPTPVYEKRIGSQVNMVSQSWDGKRFYFTSSLLANWDKKVVRFYNRGGHPHPLLDPMMRPLHLTDAEVAALVALLESLTGDNIAALIADARSVRVGNVTVESPQ